MPLATDVLKRLYRDQAGYVSKVKAATQRSLQERWITPCDAERIVKEASAATLF